MPDQYQMTAVVRRIEARQRNAAESEGTVVTLSRGFLSRKCYVVITPRDGLGSARCKIDVPIDAPERKWLLPLEILLTVQFAGRGEAEARKLVDAIHEAENPDKAVQSLVREWTNDFLTIRRLTKAQFIEGFFRLRNDLTTYLVAKASTIALTVTEIDVKIRGEDSTDPVIEVRLANVALVLQDYKPEVALTVDVDLARLPGSILPYMEINSQRVIEAEIRRELRDRFRTEVKLHAVQYDSAGQVRTVTNSVVQQIAENHGREIARLMISGKPPIVDAETTVEIELKELFKQLDYPDPVQVVIDLKLTLADLGELVRSGTDRRHLASWASTKLREAISGRLLGVNYVDLFPQFEKKLKDTQAAFAEAAKNIGYDLSRFILQTNLDFHVLQRGFDCRIENAAFPLKLRECEVVLDVETVLRITNKAELQRLFSQNTAITQTITDAVRNAVARTLREVSPEEFYLRFHGADGATGKSVAERLEDAVRDEVCKEFKPEEGVKVHITQRQDELSGVYRDLVRSAIELQQVRDPNTGIAVSVTASVNSISEKHWRQFQDRKPKIQQVEASFRLHVLSFLNDCGKRNYKELINAPGAAVLGHAQNWVNQKLAEEYGLGVRIDHWLLVDPGVGAPIITWEEGIQFHTNTLRELAAQLSKAFMEGESKEMIQGIKDRISEVERLRDSLYRDRGAKGSIFEPMDTGFELKGGSVKLLDSAGKSSGETT